MAIVSNDHEQYLRYKLQLTDFMPDSIQETDEMKHFIALGNNASFASKEIISTVYGQINKIRNLLLVEQYFGPLTVEKLIRYVDYTTLTDIDKVYKIHKFYNHLLKTINTLVWFIDENENNEHIR